MQVNILNHLNDPKQLEKIYRANKVDFKSAFVKVYPDLKGNPLADCWNERLNYESEEINWGGRNELLFVIVLSLLAGIISKLPAFLNIDQEFYYPRNIGFILFPALSAYFAWKNKLSPGKILFISITTLVSIIFINTFPNVKTSDTLQLSCIHLILVLWSILGFAFLGEKKNILETRLGYIKYNGDLLVMTALIVIAGAITSAITIGLFSLIGLNIEKFYFENIILFVLPAAPIAGTFLIQTNPQLVGKVSPVIAKIFSPLVLVMLLIYLVAMVYSAKNPYNDRDFLLLFNVLLIGVMALVFFSVAERSGKGKSRFETWVLALLCFITIIVNGVALSAILFRISEWGITPNRAAVLGGNILILVNLLLVTVQLFRVVVKQTDLPGVERQIAAYLPVYAVWAMIVTFIFPFVFGFRP